MQLLHDLLAFLQPYGVYSYIVMFAILILCGFGLPLPEDIILVSGGILAARGITEFWIVHVVCMVGVLGGDAIIFFLGRHFGPSIKQKGIFRRIISDKTDQRVTHIMQKYGDKVIFMARFMPGLRTPIFMTCGIYQVKPWKFFLLDGVAALISVPLWIYIGYVFGMNIEELEARIKQAQFGIYLTLAVVVVGFIVYTVVKKKALSKVAAES